MMAVDKSVVTPFVAAIGKVELLEFVEFYVVLDGHLLKVDTMLQAINVCFKSYFIEEAYSVFPASFPYRGGFSPLNKVLHEI